MQLRKEVYFDGFCRIAKKNQRKRHDDDFYIENVRYPT